MFTLPPVSGMTEGPRQGFLPVESKSSREQRKLALPLKPDPELTRCHAYPFSVGKTRGEALLSVYYRPKSSRTLTFTTMVT